MGKTTGGPAFPVIHRNLTGNHDGICRPLEEVQMEGMTIRDYFAAKAMSIIAPPTDYVGAEATRDSYQKWSEKAYKMADAMLEARNK